MIKIKALLPILLLLSACVSADIYLYNSTDERMRYEIFFPNGDSKTGEVKEDAGYGPNQTSLPNTSGELSTFKIFSESGGSGVEAKGDYSRCFLLAIVDGSMRLLPVGWTMDNGQSHRREITFFNATGQTQVFDVIDEKEVRKGLTLEPGKSQTIPAKHGFGGSSGFHHIRFANGDRVDNAASSGSFVLFHHDKRSPGKTTVFNMCHLTMPRGGQP